MEALVSRRKTQRSRGLSAWLAALLLAPVVVLAALGVRGIQGSKTAARQQAADQTERALRLLAEDLDRGMASLRAESEIIVLYPEALVPGPMSEAEARLHAVKRLSDEAALQELNALTQIGPEVRTSSGLPLLPMVHLARLPLIEDSLELANSAKALWRAAVQDCPSLLTPVLLERSRGLMRPNWLAAGEINEWLLRWQRDERWRGLLRRRSLQELPAWIDDEQEAYLVERIPERGEAVRMVNGTALAAMVQRAAGMTALPPGVQLEVSFRGRTMAPFAPGEPLSRAASRDEFQIVATITDSHQLYAAARRQELWLVALLGCAVLAEVGAFWSIRRAWQREVQLSRLKDDFVSSVSHELRAPLASMRLMSENLEAGAVAAPEKTREYHRLLAQECRRLATLVDNVLDFARIEQNRRVYHFAETDVAALVQDAVAIVQPQIVARRQELAVQSDAVEPPECDGIAIRQALLNLLDNASKFSSEATTTTVALGPRGAGEWQLSVSDQGPGIPAAEHARIFERFYRAGDELRRSTQGSGIGLSIVKHIVEGHGGRIELESRPGAGARFTLIFPRRPGGAEEHT